MLDKINKILSNYSCNAVSSNSLIFEETKSSISLNINENYTLGETEKYIRNQFKIDIKIFGLIFNNIPSYIKLLDSDSYQKKRFKKTDLEKKIEALSNLNNNTLNSDEDWIIRSLDNLYLKINNKNEKKILKDYLDNLKKVNTNLYNKIKEYMKNKYELIDWF